MIPARLPVKPALKLSRIIIASFIGGLTAWGDVPEGDPQVPTAEFDPSKLESIRQLQQEFIDGGICLSNVATIARKGQVIYHNTVNSQVKGDCPITRETLFPVWSMTKPITSVAAMILHERGAFELDQPASEVIPQLSRLRVKSKTDGAPLPLTREITFRDLLRHTSGIYGYDGSFHEEGTWKEVMDLDNLAQLIDLLESKPLKHQPGERYTYGLSTAVVGRAIEILANMSLSEFFEKEIFKPLGMKHTQFHMTADDRKKFQPLFVKEDDRFRLGTPVEDELYYAPDSKLFLGGEGLVSTIEDYGRFCQMLVDRGKSPTGQQIISGATLDLMLTDQLTHLRDKSDYSGDTQGLGFYILNGLNEKENQTAPDGVFGWGGYHTTHFWIDPKNALYAIFMTRLYPSPDETLDRFRKAVYDALSPPE